MSLIMAGHWFNHSRQPEGCLIMPCFSDWRHGADGGCHILDYIGCWITITIASIIRNREVPDSMCCAQI